MKALSLRMPLRFLRGNVTRLSLMVIALACGVALVCAMDLVNRAVLQAFVEIVDTMAGRAAIQVSPGGTGFFPEEVAEVVAKVPGVELAVPVVSATAFTTDESGELLTVHGVDITNDEAVRVYDARGADGMEMEDPLVVLSQPDSIVMTRTFAQRRRLEVGQRIELVTPVGRRSFTIRGLLDPEGVAHVYGGNLVVMDIFAAEAAFARPRHINRVDVVLRPDASLAEVSRSIATAVPDLKVETPKQRQANITGVIQSLQLLLRGMGLVGLAVAFLIAFNRLATVFEARLWQVGILRSVGVRTSGVWLILIKESLLLGGAGVTIGIPLGIVLGKLLLPVIATTTALNFKLVAPEARFVVNPLSLVLAAGAGVAAAMIAAALPAVRTSRMTIVGILRDRGVESRKDETRLRWLRFAILCAVTVMVVLQVKVQSASLGLFTTALIVVGTPLAARPLVQVLRTPLLPVLRWIAGPSGRFAGAILSQSARRTALTVATLGVGLGAVMWLWVVARSFERSLIDVLTPAFQSDLIVSSSHVESGAFETPVDEKLLNELQNVPGVRAVAGERVTDWHYDGGPVVLEAFDSTYFTAGDFGRWPLLGRALPDAWEAVARGDATVISSSLVLRTSLGVGDRLVVDTPGGPLSLAVAGVTMDFASPQGTLKISRSVYQRFWRDGTLTLAFVDASPTTSLDDLRERISGELGQAYQLRVLSSRELVEYYAAQVRRAFGAVDILAVMVFAVILIGVADTLAASVIERTRDFGVMRAVGVTRRRLWQMVVIEGLAVALMGITLSIVAGLILGILWVKATFPYLLGWVVELYLPYAQVGVGAVVTLLVCLLAALLPARRAARLEAAIALRYD